MHVCDCKVLWTFKLKWMSHYLNLCSLMILILLGTYSLHQLFPHSFIAHRNSAEQLQENSSKRTYYDLKLEISVTFTPLPISIYIKNLVRYTNFVLNTYTFQWRLFHEERPVSHIIHCNALLKEETKARKEAESSQSGKITMVTDVEHSPAFTSEYATWNVCILCFWKKSVFFK